MLKGEFIQRHTVLFYLFLGVKCQKVTFLPLAESHSNLYVTLLGIPGNYSPPFKSHESLQKQGCVLMQVAEVQNAICLASDNKRCNSSCFQVDTATV